MSKNQVMTEHLFYDAKEGKIENCEFYHPYNCENFLSIYYSESGLAENLIII